MGVGSSSSEGMGSAGGSGENEITSKEARQKIFAAREKLLKALEVEIQNCSDLIDLNEKKPIFGVEESGIDINQYKYPYTNLVCEGGGIKGLAYIGVVKVLEECGVMQQITRFAGTSIGALIATLLAVGYNSYDVKEIMKNINIDELARDASCGYFSLIPNLVKYYGWHPGARIAKLINCLLEVKTGNGLITFAELYEKTGTELCIVVTNVSSMSEEYLHVKTTPNMPIGLAVRMSISIPGFYQPITQRINGKTSMYVDGSIVCNYPIHCFDGWWLSMKPKNNFLRRLQPIAESGKKMQRGNRFRYKPLKNKTIGCTLYENNEIDYLQHAVMEKSTVPRGPLPDSKLSRQWAKSQEGKLAVDRKYQEITRASIAFIEALERSNVGKKRTISRKEFKDAFTKEKFSKDYKDLLFGEDCDPLTAFIAVDKNGNNEVTYNELISFMEELGVSLNEEYRDSRRTPITNFLGFINTIISAFGYNIQKIYMRHADADRTVGIKTWYVKTLDFDLEDPDKDFLIDQGKRSTIKFLENFVEENKPGKLPKKKIDERVKPTGLSISKEKIMESLIV